MSRIKKLIFTTSVYLYLFSSSAFATLPQMPGEYKNKEGMEVLWMMAKKGLSIVIVSLLTYTLVSIIGNTVTELGVARESGRWGGFVTMLVAGIAVGVIAIIFSNIAYSTLTTTNI